MARIEKRGDSYRITIYGGYDKDSKQIRIREAYTPEEGLTKKQIQKKIENLCKELETKHQYRYVEEKNLHLSEFLDIYFTEYADKVLKLKTTSDYKKLVPRINQSLGYLKLNKIQTPHLNEFYKELSQPGAKKKASYILIQDLKGILKDRGLTQKTFASVSGLSLRTISQALNNNVISDKTTNIICKSLKVKRSRYFKKINSDTTISPETVRHYHRFLSSVFSIAVKWQYISVNPCQNVILPKRKEKKPLYLDETQAINLLNLLEDESMQHKTMIKLLLYTGLRRGELCALEWKNINLEKGTLFVEKSSSYIPHIGVVEDTPKTCSSNRAIALPDAAVEMLKDYREWQIKENNSINNQTNTNHLFTSKTGKLIHPDSITSWFNNFLKKNNFPHITIHSLRHTNATLMINSHIPITTVAARLGHANPNTTTKIYTHAIKSADYIAANALNNIFSK